MQPRGDGIALGGTSEEGNWSLEPNEEARQRIVDSHIRLFAAMAGMPIETSTDPDRARFEPRESPRPRRSGVNEAVPLTSLRVDF